MIGIGTPNSQSKIPRPMTPSQKLAELRAGQTTGKAPRWFPGGINKFRTAPAPARMSRRRGAYSAVPALSTALSRWRETVARSPKRPRGRATMVAASSTPIATMRSAAARA